MRNLAMAWICRAALCTAATSLALVTGVGCGPFRGPDAHMQRGDRFFKNREFEKAAIEYLNVARAQPTNAVAIMQFGYSCFESGKMKEAFQALLYARKCGAKSDEIAMKLALIYLWAGQHAKAREEILTVLDHEPANLDALLLLADASREPRDLEDARARLKAHEQDLSNKSVYYLALGALDVRARDLEGAARSYQTAIQTDPKSADAYMQMAGLYAMQGDTNRANAAFEKASSLSPTNTAVGLRWAAFQLSQGKRKEARAIIEKALSASPDRPQLQFALAEVALQEQRVEEAMSICGSILRNHPGSQQARIMRARILLSQGKTSEAARECELVLNAYPEATEAMHLMALVQLQQRNVTKAMSLLTQAVTANPNFTAAVILLAELNLQTSQPESVIASLPAFIAKHPRELRPYLLLGTAYRTTKKFEDAVTIFRRLAALFPNEPMCLQVLGTSLVDAGREAEAAEKFAAALELRPDFAEPLAMLASQDVRLRKDQPGAVARIERQIQRVPSSAALYELLGQVHLAARDTAKAEPAFRKALELRPDSVSTLIALGKIYGIEGRTKDALASLDRALAVNSNDVAATVLSASLLQQSQRFAEARDRFERLLALAPKSVVAANNLAYLYSEHFDKPDRAYKLGMQAHDLAPHDPFIADTFGWILCRRGEWKWALSPLQESADQMKDQPDVQYHLAVCLAALGDEAGARASLARALASTAAFSYAEPAKRLQAALDLDPATVNADALRALESLAGDPLFAVTALAKIGRAHELAGRRAPARDAYNKALAKYAQHPGALLGLARIEAIEGNSAAVIDLVHKARQAAPSDPTVGVEAGRLALRHGDSRWALGVLQDSASRLPDDMDAKYALALARYAAGQVSTATELAQTAIRSAIPFQSRREAELFCNTTALWSEPGTDGAAVLQKAREALTATSENWLPALALKARAEALSKNTSAEIATLEKITAMNPDFSPALLRLAEVYAGQAKDVDKAYKLASHARELLSEDPAADRILGIVAFKKQDMQRADQLLTAAMKKLTSDPEVAFYLGMARCKRGDKTEGRRLIEKALSVRTDFPETAAARAMLAEPQAAK